MVRFGKIPSPFVLNSRIPLVDYEQKKYYDNTFIVDTSGYVPNKHAVQVLNRQFAMSMMEKLSYDLPGEIKAEAVNLFARRKNLDIAELSQHQSQLKTTIDSMVEAARKRAELHHRRNLSKSPAPPPAPNDKKDEG